MIRTALGCFSLALLVACGGANPETNVDTLAVYDFDLPTADGGVMHGRLASDGRLDLAFQTESGAWVERFGQLRGRNGDIIQVQDQGQAQELIDQLRRFHLQQFVARDLPELEIDGSTRARVIGAEPHKPEAEPHKPDGAEPHKPDGAEPHHPGAAEPHAPAARPESPYQLMIELRESSLTFSYRMGLR